MSNNKGKSREQSKQETREALLRAGLEAFVEQGVDNPSLDAICARAGLTRGAFYVHFEDRSDFLLAVIDKVLSDFINTVIASGEYGQDLRKTVDLFAGVAERGGLPAILGENLKLGVLLEAGGRNSQIGERFTALLDDAAARLVRAAREGQAAGTVRGDLEIDQVGTLLVAAAVGLTVLIEAKVKMDIPVMRRLVHRMFSTQDAGTEEAGR